MMEKHLHAVFDVAQLNPEIGGDPMFAGCLMILTEPKPQGVQGSTQVLGND